jgi:putative lipoprotein
MTNRFAIALGLAVMALAAPVMTTVAQDESAAAPAEPTATIVGTPTGDMTATLVAGTIVLPTGALLAPDAMVTVELQDTSRADAAAVTIARLEMVAPGAASTIPFALSFVPGAADPTGRYTLAVRIESSGGLAFINDTAIPAFDATGPITDVVANVVAVGS